MNVVSQPAGTCAENQRVAERAAAGLFGNSLYLLNVTRARLDILREIPGIFAGKLYKGARNLFYERMSAVKSNMEK